MSLYLPVQCLHDVVRIAVSTAQARSDGEATAAVRLKVPRTAGIRGFAPVFPLNVQCNEDPRRTRGVVSLTRDAPRLFGIAQRPASLCAFYCTCDSRRQLKKPGLLFQAGKIHNARAFHFG